MEPGFIKADSSNLPRVDVVMLGAFLSSNKDFCSAEYRNVKTSISSRPSYGDDAVSYVQLKRDGKLCIVKAKICPEQKVHAKLYEVTLMVDEEDEEITLVQCCCVGSKGGCKHSIAFLMWVHRRSEEPSCTEVESYWKKSRLSRVGTTLKYITAKELSGGKPSLPSNSVVLEKFLDEGKRRKLNNCELLKYQKDYIVDSIDRLSMHKLVLKYKEKSSDTFLQKVVLTDEDVSKVEEETRVQHQNRIWHELRYGRVTASRAFEFSRCQTSDGSLTALIMGGKLLDTPAMRRGRKLEDKVRDTVSTMLGKRIKVCGLMLSKEFPMIAGSPDGICNDAIIEIKCPTSAKNYKTYIQHEKPTAKFYAQMQLQMHLTGLQRGYFCVADSGFSVNKKVNIITVKYDDKYVSELIAKIVPLWQQNVYPLLYKGAF